MDPVIDPAIQKPESVASAPSLLDGGEPKPTPPGEGTSVLDQAAAEAKAAQDAADKIILETPDDQLDDAGKAKKVELVKAKETADKTAADKAKAEAVPEKYEFKMPEGMTLNQAFADKVTPVLKEGKVSQAVAQKLVDMYIEQQKIDADTQAAGFKKWLEDAQKETIEALGANYKEEMAYAAKLRNNFFSAETMEILNASGVSNNKSFILDLIKIGKLFSEAKLIDGKPQAGAGPVNPADVLYPKQGK